MRRLLLTITERLPVEEIEHQGVKFMERYYVATLFGWRAYIHRFVGSDPDGVHDHPWRFGVSIILLGWYLEEKRERTYVRKWFNTVNGDTFHRVIVPAGGEAWTLFVHNRRCKSWGFLRPAPSELAYEPTDRDVHASRDALIYIPLTPAKGHSNWHLTAPKGRDIRRST